MEIRNYGFALAAAMALIRGTSAHAQENTRAVQKPLSVKLGAFFPTDKEIKAFFSNTWFSGGLSLDVAKTKGAKPVLYGFYFDYTKRTTDDSISKVSQRLLGVGPSVTFLLSPATTRAQPYVGVGAGYYNADTNVAVHGAYSTGSPSVLAPLGGFNNQFTDSRTNSRFGGKLFAGYRINSGFFGEADYTYVGEIDHVQMGGLGLRVGYRF